MSSIPGRWLIAGGALLAALLVAVVALVLATEPDERGTPVRGSSETVPERSGPTPELASPEGVAGGEPTTADHDAVSARDALPTHAESEAPTGAFLRLLDRDGRTPLAKQSVRLKFSGVKRSNREWMESDADGLIDLSLFARDAQEDATALVRPTDCLERLEPCELRLRELGHTPAQAPKLVLVERARAVLSGRAVDEVTGAPLAQLALHVTSWSGMGRRRGRQPDKVCHFDPMWMVTDEEGRFHATREYPVGNLLLVLPHGEVANAVLDRAGTPVEVRFRVGPRLLLDFRPPSGRATTDFVAGLCRDPSEAGMMEEFVDPVSPWTPQGWDPAGDDASAIVAGPPPWTRLSQDAIEHPLPAFLVLLSRDGAAKGFARLDEFERYAHEPLFVEVTELAALVGSVRHEGGGGRQCKLALYRPEDPEDAPSGRRWLISPETFRFQGLAPGSYRLEFETDRGPTTTLTVDIPTSAPLELVLPDTPSAPSYTLEGRIRTESGQPLDGLMGRARVAFVSGDAQGSGRVNWKGGEGSFQFKNLQEGRYRFAPRFAQGGFPIEPESSDFEIPGSVEWIVRDGGEHQFIQLTVTAPGEFEVEGLSELYPRLSFYREPGSSWPSGQPMCFGPYPAGAFTQLVVRGDGLRTRIVTAADFTVEGEVWRATVAMEAGWSAQFWLTEDNEPVAGVVLALDGVPLPASDASGEVKAELDAKPTRLSIVTPGWELLEHHSSEAWGTLFPTGEFTLGNGGLDVFLRRTPQSSDRARPGRR